MNALSFQCECKMPDVVDTDYLVYHAVVKHFNTSVWVPRHANIETESWSVVDILYRARQIGYGPKSHEKV